MVLPVHLAVTALIAIPATAAAQSISEKAAKDEVVFRQDSDPAMRKALSKAAATLPEFLKLAANPKTGTSSYALKVGIADSQYTEYFWVNNFSKVGSSFTGTLNNEPRLVKKHKIGDQITFTEKQIADWTYRDEANRVIGNFTACALLSKEPPAEAAAFKKQYGLTCEE
jgi:uncharacterized protein YegJ (DUF2314 family)